MLPLHSTAIQCRVPMNQYELILYRWSHGCTNIQLKVNRVSKPMSIISSAQSALGGFNEPSQLGIKSSLTFKWRNLMVQPELDDISIEFYFWRLTATWFLGCFNDVINGVIQCSRCRLLYSPRNIARSGRYHRLVDFAQFWTWTLTTRAWLMPISLTNY